MSKVTAPTARFAEDLKAHLAAKAPAPHHAAIEAIEAALETAFEGEFYNSPLEVAVEADDTDLVIIVSDEETGYVVTTARLSGRVTPTVAVNIVLALVKS